MLQGLAFNVISGALSLCATVNLCGGPPAATPQTAAAWIDLPANYQNLSAVAKADALWAKIEATKYSKLPTWSDVGGAKQVIDTGFVSIAPAFKCNELNSDILPVGRVRGIHSLAVVGKVELSMLPDVAANNFTGFLARGSNATGIVRLSLAGNPSALGVVPGVGLKLLVDGRQSVNIVANYDLDGQEKNANFFANFVRTSIPYPTKLKPIIIARRFEQIEQPVTSLPVRDLARLGAKGGNPVMNPVYPWMLKLVPNSRLKFLIHADSTNDFRQDLAEQVTPGPLYDVYAADSLDDPDALKIGTLTLKTPLVAASFGDSRLCFKHQRNKPSKTDEL